MQPELLLLDEPLSALDALTRARLQDELADICAREKRTIVLITNDVDEALLLSDRVVTLTRAPAATFGREFDVSLARPRDRGAMNHDADYIRLRGEITRYLMSLGEKRDGGTGTTPPPNVVPIRRERGPAVATPPEAVLRAGASPRDERYLQFSDVGKTYPTPDGPLTVVDGFELSMDKGEFVTLIGHSGCGKSTVLSMAAGLNVISDGGIVLDGRHVTDAGPERAVVFQAPSLMPWMTASENVALGVERVYPHAAPAERRDVIEYYLERVGLADAMHRRAAELSNGMQQRVGIARAFALSPKLLLLDEPFGMLDSLTRWELQDVLMDVWARTKVTAVCVTHDVDEAILLADRVVMMSNGPRACVGNVMEVDLPRPRTRDALLAHPDYYAYREELLDFLEAYEGGANPPPEVIEAIAARRAARQREAMASSAPRHRRTPSVRSAGRTRSVRRPSPSPRTPTRSPSPEPPGKGVRPSLSDGSGIAAATIGAPIVPPGFGDRPPARSRRRGSGEAASPVGREANAVLRETSTTLGSGAGRSPRTSAPEPNRVVRRAVRRAVRRVVRKETAARQDTAARSDEPDTALFPRQERRRSERPRIGPECHPCAFPARR